MSETVDASAAVSSWPSLPYVPVTATSLLDVGCDVGTVLQEAYKFGIRRLYGIDINPYSIEVARAALAALPGVVELKVVQGSADVLPFPDSSIDVATSFEVIEHVPADLRPGLVREVYRVLRPGAPFIISTPAAGLFAWLDPNNMRFTFPRLFGVISKAIGGQGRERGYEGQKHGIVWHHHFDAGELHALLEPSFEIEHFSWRGCLLAPICWCLAFPFYRRRQWNHPVMEWLHRVEQWEMSIEFPPALACNVLLVARKRR